MNTTTNLEIDMEKLTKENFWNDLYDQYPGEMKKFCDWIDDYKKRVDWQKLFFTPHATHKRDIKYHDLPIAMQIGIFLQYVAETENWGGIELPSIQGMATFATIPLYIQEFFQYESSINTHNAPVHPIRLQSDAAEAQDTDQADNEGADGRSGEATEGREGEIDVADSPGTERRPIESPETDTLEDGKSTVLKELEERVRKHGHASAIETAADDIVALQFELEQEKDRHSALSDALNEGRHYLMGVPSDKVTVEDALEAFGFGRNGLE